MDSKQFYEVFNNHVDILKKNGFKKETYNTYVNDANIQLKILLNKWGWDDNNGWGFLIRLSDLTILKTKTRKRVNTVEVEKDIRPDNLVESGLITYENLIRPYKKLNKPQVIEQLDNGWFSFYDSDNLNLVITDLLPLIAKMASAWSRERAKEGHPTPRHKSMSKKEWEKTKETLDKLFNNLDN